MTGTTTDGMVETTTGGWTCPYCQITVPWGLEHICPMQQPQTPEVITEGLDSIGGRHYFKCPKCGGLIRIKVGHYISFPELAQEV